MKLHKIIAAALPVLTCLGVLCLTHTAAAQSLEPSDVQALKADIAELKSLVPSQSHAMADVDYHFSNLWFAAKSGNWPLAAFYLNETKSHINWTVRIHPVRKLASGQDLDLRPLLQNIEQSGFASAKAAIEKRSFKVFETAYRQTMTQCYACHLAAEKPFLRPHIPRSAATQIIELRP